MTISLPAAPCHTKTADWLKYNIAKSPLWKQYIYLVLNGKSSSFWKIRKGCKEHSHWRSINIIVFRLSFFAAWIEICPEDWQQTLCSCLTITMSSQHSPGSPMSEGDVLEIKNSIFIQTNIIKWLDFTKFSHFLFPCLLRHFCTVIIKASEFTFISMVFVRTKLFVLFKLSHCFDLNVGLEDIKSKRSSQRKNSSSPDDKSLPVSLHVERAGSWDLLRV